MVLPVFSFCNDRSCLLHSRFQVHPLSKRTPLTSSIPWVNWLYWRSGDSNKETSIGHAASHYLSGSLLSPSQPPPSFSFPMSSLLVQNNLLFVSLLSPVSFTFHLLSWGLPRAHYKDLFKVFLSKKKVCVCVFMCLWMMLSLKGVLITSSQTPYMMSNNSISNAYMYQGSLIHREIK